MPRPPRARRLSIYDQSLLDHGCPTVWRGAAVGRFRCGCTAAAAASHRHDWGSFWGGASLCGGRDRPVGDCGRAAAQGDGTRTAPLARSQPATSMVGRRPQRPCLFSRCPHARALPQVYQGGEDVHGRRIFVGNVNYEVNEDELRDHFGKVRITRRGPNMRSCARARGGGGGWRQLSACPLPTVRRHLDALRQGGLCLHRVRRPQRGHGARSLSPPLHCRPLRTHPVPPFLLATHRPPPTRGRTPSAGCTTLR